MNDDEFEMRYRERMAEIGRRGGSRMSERKRQALIRNARKPRKRRIVSDLTNPVSPQSNSSGET